MRIDNALTILSSEAELKLCTIVSIGLDFASDTCKF